MSDFLKKYSAVMTAITAFCLVVFLMWNCTQAQIEYVIADGFCAAILAGGFFAILLELAPRVMELWEQEEEAEPEPEPVTRHRSHVGLIREEYLR